MRSFNTAVYDSIINGPLVFEVRVAPTPEFASEVIDNPLPLVRTIGSPSNVSASLIVVVVGTAATKYGVPAVIPLVVLPNTITLLSVSPCAEPVAIVSALVIVVQVGVVPPPV